MTEPIRLVDSGELSAFEVELLRSARAEQPDARVNAALLAGIGGAAVVPALDLASSPAHSMVAPGGYGMSVWRWLSGIGGVSGAIAAGFIATRSPSEIPAACQGANCDPPSVAPAPIGETAEAVEMRSAPAVPAPPASHGERAPMLPPPTIQTSKAGKTSEAKPSPPAPSLTEEVAALEPARVALRKGDHVRALQALTRYETRFPSGVLRPEAEVLRAQARALKSTRRAPSGFR